MENWSENFWKNYFFPSCCFPLDNSKKNSNLCFKNIYFLKIVKINTKMHQNPTLIWRMSNNPAMECWNTIPAIRPATCTWNNCCCNSDNFIVDYKWTTAITVANTYKIILDLIKLIAKLNIKLILTLSKSREWAQMLWQDPRSKLTNTIFICDCWCWMP